MTKPVKALFGAVLLLLLVEVGLQAWFRSPPPMNGIPKSGPLCFVLGTSRTMRGLDPNAIESALGDAGVPRPFVANISEDGVTNFSLFDFYMTEIRPLVVDAHRRCLLAIEVRASGMNDSYANPDENAKFTRGEYRDIIATARTENALGAQLRAFDLGAAAKTLFSFTALGSGDESLARVERRLVPGGIPRWAAGRKGFKPYEEPRHADLQEATWREHYEKIILRNFHFGSTQFPMFQLLCNQARKDGVDVLLYVMPVTDVQKSFWHPPAQRQYVLTQVRQWAQSQNLPWFDFDTGHTFTHEEFQDTHHLTPAGAARLSRDFASKVFLPHLK